MAKTPLRAGMLTAAVLVGLAGAGPHAPRRPGPRPAGPALHLVLNIPANRLDVLQGDSLLASFPVSVGKPGHETPAGDYRITHLVWNPWWNPPDSRWARGKRPQAPGPGNPMGRVKMFFSDLYYIHGTPDVEQLGEPASHGCVRMANADAVKVARLVQDYGAPGAAVDVDDLLAHPSKTRTVWLDMPVAFRVAYTVAEVRNGRLLIHPDVYGSGRGVVREQVVQALVQSGEDPAKLDQVRLEGLVRRSGRRGLSVPLDSVMTEAGAAGAVSGSGA